jgi:hypothetical protein
LGKIKVRNLKMIGSPSFVKQAVADMVRVLDPKNREKVVKQTFDNLKQNPEVVAAVSRHIDQHAEITKELKNNPDISAASTSIYEVQDLWRQFAVS